MDKALKTCFLLLMAIAPVFFCSCTAQETKKEKGKLLIVYLSRTNNTKQVAEIIQKEVGGDLVALELKDPYPENYDSIVAQVAEENESGYLPPLKTRIDNFNQYDVVFLGFPTWGMRLPPPMKSFLNKYNMSDKTVIPFNTNAGYGIGSSFKTVKEMCPNATILEGFSTKGGIERDGIYFVMEGDKKIKVKEEVVTWLRQIKFL
ncbi:flavodoxin [Galbibacter marinus]|uniref:Flavodoxin n=1 Tax=Galbibacter marinus TaxID=555500 RepID=K2QHC7_9FLAO|nr:flavodoxin [Galbibacter marinus]EKF54152.1 flavodoxin [Galbibacter marinus]